MEYLVYISFVLNIGLTVYILAGKKQKGPTETEEQKLARQEWEDQKNGYN